MHTTFSSEELLSKLKEKTGKTTEEITGLVEEKTSKFSGLLSREAAIFLLAKEAGLVEGQETIIQPTPINQLQEGQINIDIIGIAKQVFPVKEFQNKNKPGTGKRASVLLADSTGEIFVTFWHQDSEKTVNISIGCVLLLKNLSVSSYNNQKQLNFGYRSEIKLNPEQAKEITLPKIETKKTSIKEITVPAVNLNIESVVEEVFPVKEFTRQTGETGKLQRVQLMDETGSIQAVAWDEKVSESEMLKPGEKILLENTRSKAGWQGGLELSIDSNTRIVVLEQKN